jgi:cytochrome b561
LLKFSDARNFGRTVTGLLLISAPALLVIGSIVAPDTDHKNKLRELSAIAAHKGTYVVSGVIFLLGTLLMVFAGAGLIRMFRGRRGVTLGQVAG